MITVYEMSKEYDFDIHHYSIRDIESLFQLSNNQSYTADDIRVRKREFYEKIMALSNIHGETSSEKRGLIRKLNVFLDQACDLLVYFIRDRRAESLLTTNSYEFGKEPKNASVLTSTTRYEISQKKNQDDLVLDYHNNVRALTTNHHYLSGNQADRAQNELIPPNVPEFNMVMPNEFNPGKMNPIHTPVLTKCLNVDTRFRDNLYTTQSSDFIFTLPTKIRKVVSMQLSAYEFPVTFYGTSQSYGNNFLHVYCTYFDAISRDSSAVAHRRITVPDGNYSANDLLLYLNKNLCPRNEDESLLYTGLDSSGIFNTVQFSLDLNDNGSGSGKVTLGTQEVTGYYDPKLYIISLGLDFTLDINGETDLISPTSKIGWNLGFTRPKYNNSKLFISDTLPDPATIRYLYLVVKDFNNSVNNHFVGAFNNWILNDNILARIPINGQYFNILMENQLSQHLEPRKYFGPVDIQRLHIQLLDDHGRILNINGANYSLCMTFKCLYD
jgi:hypothetical protein